jgi:hypothetical protein
VIRSAELTDEEVDREWLTAHPYTTFSNSGLDVDLSLHPDRIAADAIRHQAQPQEPGPAERFGYKHVDLIQASQTP